MKHRAVIEVFFRDKPFMVLNALRSGNGKIHAAELARQAKCTYSHTRKILMLFEENRLISFDRSGARHIISLTEKGNQLAEGIETMKIAIRNLCASAQSKKAIFKCSKTRPAL